jgi:hypothetical protein
LSVGGVALFVVGALVGSARPAVASSFWLETNIGVNLGCDPYLAGSCPVDNHGPVNIELWGPIPDPGNVSLGYGLLTLDQVYGSAGEQLIVCAASYADYGVLQVRASAEYDLTGLADPGGYRFVAASGQFTEVLTPTADASLIGTPGLLSVSLGVDGTIVSNGSAGGLVLLSVGWDSSQSSDSLFYASSNSVSTTIVQNIPFIWGESIGFSVWMAAGGGTARLCLPGEDCNFGATFVQQNDIGAGSSDFFHTLALTGLVPYDQDGNPVLGATFGSGSGQRYTIEGVDAVPEPGTMLLFGTGLAMGIRRLRRRTA